VERTLPLNSEEGGRGVVAKKIYIKLPQNIGSIVIGHDEEHGNYIKITC